MSTVLFDSPFNKDIFIKSNNILWRYIWHKRIKQLVLWSSLSIIFLCIGVISIMTGSEAWQPSIFIGIITLSLSLLIAIEVIFSRRRHNNNVERIANEYKRTNSEYIFSISDNGVYFKDFQSDISLNWSAFKYFAVYKEHILLFPKNYLSGGLVVSKSNVDITKYEQYLSILNSNLIENT